MGSCLAGAVYLRWLILISWYDIFFLCGSVLHQDLAMKVQQQIYPRIHYNKHCGMYHPAAFTLQSLYKLTETHFNLVDGNLSLLKL